MKRTCAFTLIEALVALAIVAALAAIIAPVLESMRMRAHETACLSNLKQLSTGIFAYAPDYDEQYPSGGDCEDLHTDVWQTALGGQYAAKVGALPPLQSVLQPYLHSSDIWRCPDDQGFDYIDSAYMLPLSAHPTCFQAYGSSYLYRTELCLAHIPMGSIYGSIGRVKPRMVGPSNINLLWDAAGFWHGRAPIYEYQNGRFNVVLCDGHAKNMSYYSLMRAQKTSLQH